MKFERNTKSEQMFKDLLGDGHPGMHLYICKAGDWQFLVSYDTLHNIYAASYKPIHNLRGQAVQCEPPPEGQRLKTYETQHAAEQACFNKYRELRANN